MGMITPLGQKHLASSANQGPGGVATRVSLTDLDEKKEMLSDSEQQHSSVQGSTDVLGLTVSDDGSRGS
ncbi:hypothetical protein J4Q44_G00186990 [Coregonus suidteri]|uniref:Uncharacterized protein n=1 Tax=Coregonus suidteri TaxID=861788 RepID=A0AAN8LJS7_9TELE